MTRLSYLRVGLGALSVALVLLYFLDVVQFELGFPLVMALAATVQTVDLVARPWRSRPRFEVLAEAVIAVALWIFVAIIIFTV